MNTTQFQDLCRDTSRLLGVEAIDALAEEGHIEVDGVGMSLIFDEEEATDRLFCYVDVGPINQQNRVDVYDNLLTLNLLSGSKTSGVYALDPLSGHAIFAVHLMQPDRLQGRHLAEAFHHYAQRSLRLRDSLLQEAAAGPAAEVLEQILGKDGDDPLASLA